MTGGSVSDAFSFSLLSVPFILLGLLQAAAALLVVLTRGNHLIRASVLAVLMAAAPWTVGSAVTASCNDPAIVAKLAPIYVGLVAFLGPALMLVMLALTGKLERHRGLLAVATVVAGSSCLLCWTTDLMVAGVWETPWGLLYPIAGPLNDLHLANFAVWAAVGVVLVRRGRQRERNQRRRLQAHRLAIILVLVALCATDGLLSRGVGVYPFSVVPGFFAIVLALVGILRHDLLHARGFDRAGAYELGIFAVVAAALFAAMWLAVESVEISNPLLVVLIATPIIGLGQVGVGALRGRFDGDSTSVARDAERALEEFVAQASRVRAVGALASRLDTLLSSHAGLSRVRLLVADEEGDCREVTAGQGDSDGQGAVALQIDARARAWLIANRASLALQDLATVRLGGLREPVEELMNRVDSEIVVPLVDRGRLVGLIAARSPDGGRALRDAERVTLDEAARASAQALTYVALLHEAETRVEMAKEVEVAAAVQHARAAGEQRLRFGNCRLTSYYQPAEQFGGHWWAAHELPDGRVLVVLGDVVGQGVSAALVSFTAEGACETAQRMYGASLELISLLQLLNSSLRGVDGSRYGMSCCAALFDLDAGTVTFANAGHPFPYVCRRSGDDEPRGRCQLRALVSRGTPMGGDELIVKATAMNLEPDDVVVFFSDSVVDQTNPEGVPYGYRRLQKVLREKVRPAGRRACDVILDDAKLHYGDRPVDDDLNLIVVRLGAAER